MSTVQGGSNGVAMAVPLPLIQGGAVLTASQGVLVSVAISVDPPGLEELLELLANVGFPINPEIFHEAARVYRGDEGVERIEPTTLVEFPAYSGQVEQLKQYLNSNSPQPICMIVTDMLAKLRATQQGESGFPKGVGYYRHNPYRATAGCHSRPIGGR